MTTAFQSKQELNQDSKLIASVENYIIKPKLIVQSRNVEPATVKKSPIRRSNNLKLNGLYQNITKEFFHDNSRTTWSL